MIKEANSKQVINKELYKVFLYLLKILPIIISVLILLCNILDSFNIITTIINYSIYILLFGFLYVTSYVFEFCKHYRFFLHYIVINNLIAIFDTYIGIPINSVLSIYIILFGILLFIMLYKHVKNNKKHPRKNNK